ncbi:MAG: cytosine permease, partial [Fervidicoccaceae archaeon]
MSSYKDHPDLLPIPSDKRSTTGWQYVLMILSMAITTSIFFLGWISQILGLNLLQTVVAAFIGNTVIALVMYFNGYVGIKYGIPFPVQLRPAFGYRGSILPMLVRAIVSIFWYGVDGYIAAWAMTEMILVLLGKPSDWIIANGLLYTPYTFIFYLLLVWTFGYFRITGIKYFDTLAGPLLLIFFAWFTYYMAGLPNLPGKMPSWTQGGVPWISNSFFLAVAVQTAWWGTIALN